MFWRKKKSFTEETKPVVENALHRVNEKVDGFGNFLSPEPNSNIRSAIDKNLLFKLEFCFIFADIIVRAFGGGSTAKFARRRLLMSSFVDSMVTAGGIRHNDKKIVEETAFEISHYRAPIFMEHAKNILSMNNTVDKADSLPPKSAAGYFKLQLFVSRCAETITNEYVIDSEAQNVSGHMFEAAFQYAEALWKE